MSNIFSAHRVLSTDKKAAVRSADKEANITARARLRTGSEAQRRHQQRLESDLNTNSAKDLWQQVQNVTGYKNRRSSLWWRNQNRTTQNHPMRSQQNQRGKLNRSPLLPACMQMLIF